MRRHLATSLVGIAFSAILLWLALRAVEPGSVVDALRSAHWLFGPPFLLSLTLFCVLKAARWRVLLRGAQPISGTTLIEPVVLGYAATTLLPMQLGEVVRGAVAAKRLRLSTTTALVSIAVERVLDLLALLMMLGISVLIAPRTSDQLQSAGIAVAVVTFTLAALLLSSVFSPRARAWLERAVLSHAPPAIGAWGQRQLRAVDDGLSWVREPSNYLPVVALTTLQWMCMLGCILFALQATGIEVGLTAAMAVLVCTLLGMSLPAGPGYVGTLQLAFVVGLRAFDVSAAHAIAASIVYQAMLFMPLLLSAAMIIALRGPSRIWSGDMIKEPRANDGLRR